MRFHDIRHTCATLLRCADQKSVAPGSPDLELPSIGWQLFILDSSQSDPIALPAFLDTYATRLLTEPLNRILRSSEVRPAFVGVLVVRLLAGIILGRGGGEEQGSGEPPQRPTAPKPATTLLRTPAPRRAITRIYSSYVNQNQEVLR